MESKPKLIEVTGDDKAKALATKEDLGTPMFILDGARMYMLADQFRQWKGLGLQGSQHTSGAEHE